MLLSGQVRLRGARGSQYPALPDGQGIARTAPSNSVPRATVYHGGGDPLARCPHPRAITRTRNSSALRRRISGGILANPKVSQGGNGLGQAKVQELIHLPVGMVDEPLDRPGVRSGGEPRPAPGPGLRPTLAGLPAGVGCSRPGRSSRPPGPRNRRLRTCQPLTRSSRAATLQHPSLIV